MTLPDDQYDEFSHVPDARDRTILRSAAEIARLSKECEGLRAQQTVLRDALKSVPRWSVDKYDQRCLGCGVVAYFNDKPTRETVKHFGNCWNVAVEQALATLDVPEEL